MRVQDREHQVDVAGDDPHRGGVIQRDLAQKLG
jgi:hypothetical protein